MMAAFLIILDRITLVTSIERKGKGENGFPIKLEGGQRLMMGRPHEIVPTTVALRRLPPAPARGWGWRGDVSSINEGGQKGGWGKQSCIFHPVHSDICSSVAGKGHGDSAHAPLE